MADPIPTPVDKVEAALSALLTGWPGLEDWDIVTDQPMDVALEGNDLRAIVIRTIGPTFDASFEYGADLLNVATIDIETVVKEDGEVLFRRCREGLAHCQAAIDADPTLGGMLQTLEPRDQAPGDGQRRDAGAISTQFHAEWHTSTGSPFVIIGHSGQTF